MLLLLNIRHLPLTFWSGLSITSTKLLPPQCDGAVERGVCLRGEGQLGPACIKLCADLVLIGRFFLARNPERGSPGHSFDSSKLYSVLSHSPSVLSTACQLSSIPSPPHSDSDSEIPPFAVLEPTSELTSVLTNPASSSNNHGLFGVLESDSPYQGTVHDSEPETTHRPSTL